MARGQRCVTILAFLCNRINRRIIGSNESKSSVFSIIFFLIVFPKKTIEKFKNVRADRKIFHLWQSDHYFCPRNGYVSKNNQINDNY